MVCLLALPWEGSQAQMVPCTLARSLEGPAGGFLVTAVTLLFNILLIKLLKSQEAGWKPNNITLLVSS